MGKPLAFTKMHGLGNDFLVIDARNLEALDWPALARAMCDRHFGVGADQLLTVGSSALADVKMRLFNTDGFEAEMCGNGIRCIGKFVYERHIVRNPEISIETLGGIKRLWLAVDHGRVSGATVAMGTPLISTRHSEVEVRPVGLAALTLHLSVLDMGNPHAVTFVNQSVGDFDLVRIGPLVERHPLFPNRTNFEVVNVESSTSLRVRVWERSAGITLACGTGACAAMAAAHVHGQVADEVDVHLPGGTLQIYWDGAGEITMSGPAATVFEGEWTLS